MTVTTTRQKALNQLTKLGPASPRDLARALRLSEATVRHHLRVLVSDGRVTPLGPPYRGDERKGVGRPVKIYALSPALAGDNLPALTSALLAESTVPMETLAKHILDASALGNQPLTRRLTLLVEKLNAKHYQARWEAGADGPRVIFGRCPYAAVIEAHPELCQMDASALANFLRMDARQSAKIEKGRGMCVFGVR
jgi:predicted ArsR family transcriptional regulator